MKATSGQKQPGILRSVIHCLVASLLLAGFNLPAYADDFVLKVSFATPQSEAMALNLLIGQSRMIRFDQPIGRLSVSNPEIAEAVVVASDQVVVNGKAFGHVNFIAWDADGQRPVVFDVAVRVNLALMDSLMRQLFPSDTILLSQANGSVVLSGNVSDAKKVTMAESTIQAAGFKTVNLLQGPFKDVAQVQLNVQVAEVNRSRARDLGIAYLYQARPGLGGYVNNGTGPASLQSVVDGVISGTLASSLNVLFLGGNLAAFLQALSTNGALRSLAEPNLIAMDGAEASFLAGGEFPVPIVQGVGSTNTVTVVFKEFGVRLSFKPTIVDEDHIRLELQPEVSTIDFANGVSFSGFNIPALRTRRAKTFIELKNNQSFALAGLLDTSDTKSLSKVPWVGDIPILGALFRSTSFQKQETELMFIITATLVRPIGRDSLPAMPGLDGLKSKSPLTEKPAPKSGSGGGGGAADEPAKKGPENSEKPEKPGTPAKPETPEKPETHGATSSSSQLVGCRLSQMQQAQFGRTANSSGFVSMAALDSVVSRALWTIAGSGVTFPR